MSLEPRVSDSRRGFAEELAATGEPERCGYLDVQLPIDADDPLKPAAERAEAHGWSEDRYSFSSRSLDG